MSNKPKIRNKKWLEIPRPLMRIRVGDKSKDFYPDKDGVISLESKDIDGITLGEFSGEEDAHVVFPWSQ